MKAARQLVKCLEQAGVKWVFGVPGEENLDLIEALRTSSIRFIVTRHEQGAAMMAATVGQLTGKPGVCLATLGPGATNLITGIANANLDHQPVIAITGQSGIKSRHKGSHQYLDLQALFEPVTKWSVTVNHPDTITEMMGQAFRIAVRDKPGSVHINLPEDVAKMRVGMEEESLNWISSPGVVAREKDLQHVADIINQSQCPLILAGPGIARGKAQQELQRFAEKLQAPVMETFMGKGSLSWKHPLSLVFGFYTDDRLTKATDYTDLIIAIGYDGVEYSAESWNRGKKPVIHIDTLYSETDVHYPIQGELAGDIAANLENLLGKVYPRNQSNSFYTRLREENLLEQKELAEDLTFPVKPQKLVYALRSVLKGKDMAVVDVGAHKIWMGRLYPADFPQTCLISNGFASMGVALPGAIAAKMVYPDRNVVAVCGDGALQMNIQEMETAFRLKLPIVILVWRDGGYGLIDWEQKQKGYPTASVRFENPDLVRLAEAYGGKGLRLERTEELISVLEKALQMDVPVLVDCPVDYSENMKLTERIQFKGDG